MVLSSYNDLDTQDSTAERFPAGSVVDKFSLECRLERRTVYTTDPRYPALAIVASLPHLIVYVNKEKVKRPVTIFSWPLPQSSHAKSAVSASYFKAAFCLSVGFQVAGSQFH